MTFVQGIPWPVDMPSELVIIASDSALSDEQKETIRGAARDIAGFRGEFVKVLEERTELAQQVQAQAERLQELQQDRDRLAQELKTRPVTKRVHTYGQCYPVQVIAYSKPSWMLFPPFIFRYGP